MRGLLELLRCAAVLPQQMLQNRLVAPVRIEEIPVRVLRALELRHMRELEQSIHHRQRAYGECPKRFLGSPASACHGMSAPQ